MSIIWNVLSQALSLLITVCFSTLLDVFVSHCLDAGSFSWNVNEITVDWRKMEQLHVLFCQATDIFCQATDIFQNSLKILGFMITSKTSRRQKGRIACSHRVIFVSIDTSSSFALNILVKF